MYAVLCNPIFWNQINQAVTSKGEEIIVKAIDKYIDIMSEFERIGRTPIKHIIIDMTAVIDTKYLVTAIKRYKIKNDKDKAQIIIIAPNAVPPNPTLDALVKIGVFDILSPAGDLEDMDIRSIITEALEEPYTFKKAVKWFIDGDTDSTNINLTPAAKDVVEKTVTIMREKIVGTVVIALAGTMQRIGTTHAALSIANYLKNCNYKIAVVEYHKSNHFSFIKNNYEDIHDEGDYFTLDGLYYYPYSDNLRLLDILQKDFNYVVLDMGLYNSCDINEFKRAGSKIIVSGAKDWELTELELILRSCDKNAFSKYNYYFNFADKDSFEDIKASMVDQEFGQYRCFHGVYNPNPFVVNKDSIEIFKSVLKSILPNNKEPVKNKSSKLFSFISNKK